jgi:hypothetical protein
MKTPSVAHTCRCTVVGGSGGASIKFVAGRRTAERLLECLADEPLPRVAHEDRHAEVEEYAGTGHELAVVGVGLPEADARVEADFFEGNAGGDERIATGGEVGVDLGHDVVVAGSDLHRLRRAPHVHGAHAGARLPSHAEHIGVALEAGDVVDDLGAEFEGAGGDGRLRGVDRDGHTRLRSQPLHNVAHAPQFLVGGDGRGERPRALATDVEDVGPLGPGAASRGPPQPPPNHAGRRRKNCRA